MTHLYPTLPDEQRHFDQIRQEIAQRLRQAHISMDQRRALLIEQRLFLWENYYENAKEMDLHELALKELKTHYDYDKSQTRTLLRLYDAPFFARIDFQADDEQEPEAVYIGTGGLYDPDTFTAHVYDWRSPVASMYYDFACTNAYYDCPAGRITGQISLKRQYTISDGRLCAMADTSLTIDDALLVDVLAQGADKAMHQIAATIQQEQNQVVRNDQARVLIVQGVAGSGKTSVALHRAAYLMYPQRGGLRSESIIILSPNALFTDYVSQVLPQLGEEQIWQTTFQDFAVAMLGKLSVQSPQDHLEDLLDGQLSPVRQAVIREKAGAPFLKALDDFCDATDELYDDFQDIYLGGQCILRTDEMLRLYRTSRTLLRPFSRMKRIRALFEDRERALRDERIAAIADQLDRQSEPGYYLSRQEILFEARALHNQEVAQQKARLDAMTELDAAPLYRDFLRAYFRKTAGHDAGRFYCAWQRGQISFEDVAPLLYLMLRLGKIRPVSQMRHVLVDEAQDYTTVQFRLLSLLYPGARFTILGDPGQLLNPAMPIGGLEAAKGVFDDALTLTLPRCYRLPEPISAYADSLTGRKTPQIGRPGEPVVQQRCKTLAQQAQACADFLESVSDDPKSLCAIITRTARQAYLLWRALPKSLHARLLQERDDALGGVMVLPCYLAKGLEFDHVAVVTDGSDKAFEYVAVTRAMARLLVVHTC
jgi:DNA helicase-2/ATP-dependent DNA helicase PcrA